eukprot:4152025-Amphidinium_carterae.1
MHPDNEQLAKRLAGLHLFFPLLSLPWPARDPAVSHLDETLASAGSSTVSNFCKVLRCVVDTELAATVIADTPETCMTAVTTIVELALAPGFQDCVRDVHVSMCCGGAVAQPVLRS